MLRKQTILDVGITNAKNEEILEYIVKNCRDPKKKWYIVTPNPEILVIADKNPEYKLSLNQAQLSLPDGVGVIMAGRVLKKGPFERFSGVELVEKVCQEVADLPITVGFLGGRGGVAEKTAECLQRKYPNLQISFALEEPEELFTGFFARGHVSSFPFAATPHTRLIPPRAKLNAKRYPLDAPINILFVAFGSPKQELWISENLEKIPAVVTVGVGGSFDMLSGKVRRAPKLVQNIGLEWLYRLIRQPWRAKRQLRLIKFVYLVCKEKFASRKKGV